MILLSSVLVATDFGDTSTAALAYGRNLARAFGGTLHVLHVAEQVTATAAAEFYLEDLGALQKGVEDAAAKQLAALLTADDRALLSAKAVVRASADVAHTIVEYAKAAHVDVIVVGTHGRGPVAHFVMGSVAERVVRTAPCPVLVVRPNEHEFIVPDPVGVHTRI
jgi:universal stress protein A